MSWVATAIVGTTVVNAYVGREAAGDAADAQAAAGDAGIAEQRAARRAFEERTEPFRQAGLSALGPLLQSLGIEAPAAITDPVVTARNEELAGIPDQIQSLEDRLEQMAASPTGGAFGGAIDARDRRPIEVELENLRARQEALQSQMPEEGAAPPTQAVAQQSPMGDQSLLEQINPMVSFLRDEGFEDIQESAAAGGRLGAGGTLKDLTQFNTNLASTVVPQLQQQRFNQLFNLLGLGQNAATGQGTAALSTASNIGNLMSGVGQAQAGGILGQGQAIQQGIGGLAGVFGAQQQGLFNNPGMTFDQANQAAFPGITQPFETGGF